MGLDEWSGKCAGLVVAIVSYSTLQLYENEF